MFQSLFCWKFLLGSKVLSIFRIRIMMVSILVLLEVPLRLLPQHIQQFFLFVSILVLLEVPLRPSENQPWFPPSNPVSILVLLEVPLRLTADRSKHQARRMFQSLFCWKFLLGIFGFQKEMPNNKFQSLFCWKFLLGIFGFQKEMPNNKFQSLFCWKFLLGLLFQSLFLLREIVSILVLLEVPLRHRTVGKYVTKGCRFNPCFAGSSSQAEIRRFTEQEEARFQSLFCWKFLLGQAPEATTLLLHLCFNPCFAGSSSQATRKKRQREINPKVSILVLLEVPLRHKQYFITSKIYISFNPCFAGSSSQACRNTQ